MMAGANAQPITEVMPRGETELLAGLYQAKHAHAIARLPAVATDRAARNLSLDDKAAQNSLRRTGMKWGFRPL